MAFKNYSAANGIAEGLNQGLLAFNTARRESARDDLEKQRYALDLASKGYRVDPDTNELIQTDEAKSKQSDENEEKRIKTYADLFGKSFEARAKGLISPDFDSAVARYGQKAFPAQSSPQPDQSLMSDPAENAPAALKGLMAAQASGTVPSVVPHSQGLFQKDPNWKSPEQRQQETELRKVQMQIDAEARTPKQNQSQAAPYAKRLEDSEKVFQDLSNQGFNAASVKDKGLLGSLINAPMIGGIARMGADEKVLQQDQAERSFVNAVLRRESGSAIAPSEFASAEKQYFPRPGDSEKVLSQKARNRQVAAAGLRAEAGPAYQKLDDELVKQPARTPVKQKKSSGSVAPDFGKMTNQELQNYLGN